MDMSLFSFARQAADMAVAGAWQGLAIAAALALGLKCMPRVSASHRFVLWLAGFGVVAALPLAPLVLSVLGSPRSAAFEGAPAAAAHSWLQVDAHWTLALASMWAIASLIRAADLAIHIVRLRRLWVSAMPVELPGLSKSQRAFQICSTQWIDRPSVIGFFAPRVLIPDWLLPRLTAGELEQIVLHESTHLLRRDDWSNLFQKICLILFPLNPALWVMDRRLAKEREMACDEAVVRATQAPRAYAACLASVAERGLAHRAEALSLGAWQHRPELARRVRNILHHKKTLPPVAARVLLATLGCALVTAALALAHAPRLVAFTAPERANKVVQSAAAASSELGDAVYPNNPRNNTLAPGVFAEQAKAILSAPRMARPVASRAQHRKSAADGELRSASSLPGGFSTAAERAVSERAIETRPRQDEPEQFVVLATWEQVEAPARNTRAIADYDTNSVAGAPAAGTTPPSPAAANHAAQRDAGKSLIVPATGRMTVTRLIFRVISPSSQANAKSNADSKCKSSQPALIPFGDGWLVIQL
jgi:beta-lactamase regulating signal transducer with metallopeptidase domain